MSERIDFDAIVLDEELGPIVYETGGDVIANYCRDWDDPDPLFLDRSSLGPPIVPPAHMAGLACFALLHTRYDSAGTLNTRSEQQNLKAVPVGETLTVHGRVIDKFVRRGLEYVVVQSEMYDGGGEIVRRGLDHVALSLDRRAA